MSWSSTSPLQCYEGYLKEEVHWHVSKENIAFSEKSKIHNHADYGCLQKILCGNLQEIIYDINNFKNIKENELSKNSINYIDNKIGYHKIINKNEVSVSLHIYSPPKFITKYF